MRLRVRSRVRRRHGAVRLPPDLTDAKLTERVHWYETLPFFEADVALGDLQDMYGCNMLMRRSAIDRVGGFDERLGPGAGDPGGDTDLSCRIRAAGMRIGYVPEAVLYQAVEVARLTPEFLRLKRSDGGR